MENENIVWQSRLDKKYNCSVVRVTERTGQLKIINEENNQVLLEKEVGLSYGSIFGAEMDDVRTWVDNRD